MFAAINQFFQSITILLQAFSNGAQSIKNLSEIGVHKSEDYLNEANIQRQNNLAAMLKDNNIASLTAPTLTTLEK